MYMRANRIKAVAVILGGLLSSGLTKASDTNLPEGSYVTPIFNMVSPDDDSNLDDSDGWALALGYRKDFYAMEIVPSVIDLDGIDLASIAVNGLLFPFDDNGLYLTTGISASNYKDYPVPNDLEDFSTYNFEAGIGYLYALPFEKKGYAIRAEAKYRVSHREEEYNDADTDLDVPKDFKQFVFSIGFQIPLGN